MVDMPDGLNSTRLGVWYHLDIEHHALIPVVEYVAMQDKFSDITSVRRPLQYVIVLLDEYRVAENALEVAVLRVGCWISALIL